MLGIEILKRMSGGAGSAPPAPGDFTLEISPSPVAASAHSSTITTGNVTATPTGGTPPYTFLWTLDTGDGHTFTIQSPTLNITTLRAAGVLTIEPMAEADFQCDCTDSLAAVATAYVHATFYRI